MWYIFTLIVFLLNDELKPNIAANIAANIAILRFD